MIITLTGENTFAIAQAKRQLMAEFIKRHGQHGVDQIDGDNLEVSRLPDLLQGVSLFAPTRMVIFKDLASNKLLQEPLAEALSTAADETTVVIADSKLDKRTKLYKFLKTKTNFKDLSNLNEAQLTAWAQECAESYGCKIERAVAAMLVSRVAGDQWRLSQEIAKLSGYPQITSEIIEELVEPSPEGTAFEMLDAALAGNHDRVQKMINALKNEEDPYRLFGLLASQIHALAVVAHAGSRSADAIAKDTNLHPYVVRKTQTVARRLNQAQIAAMVSAVAMCDKQIKSTGVEPWSLITLCLFKIAQR